MNSLELLGGRYEVRDILGFGATAEVCDGWDTRLSRPVAIKVLHRGLSSQADVRQRFELEARAAAALNHPNIVRVYDVGDDNDTPFIVMERLPGDTLGDRIALGPLPQAQVSAALASVLAALAVAHDAGMLHRDIKPGNILLAPSGSVKVADFGIVKTAGSVHTTTGHIVGTLAYMSPDRVAGKPASVGDDLYAAGVVGYEALTGRKPFVHEDIMPLAHAIIEGLPPPVNELRPDVDPALADVIERAMSRDPLRRFGSADGMRSALSGRKNQLVSPLAAGLIGRPPTALRDAGPHRSPVVTAVSPAAAVQRPPKRSPKVVLSAAVLGAMALAALAFASNPSSTTPPTTPGNISVGTPVPSPIGVTEVPSSTAQVVPPTPVPVAGAAPAPAPAPVVEQATQRELVGTRSSTNGSGVGNGNNGNGNSNSRYGNGDSGNGIGSTKIGDGNGDNANGDNGNGHNGNGNNGNGNNGNGNNGNGNGNGGNGRPK